MYQKVKYLPLNSSWVEVYSGRSENTAEYKTTTMILHEIWHISLFPSSNPTSTINVILDVLCQVINHLYSPIILSLASSPNDIIYSNINCPGNVLFNNTD